MSRTVDSHLCKNLASVAGPGLKIKPVRTLGVHKDGPKPAGLGRELGSESHDNPPHTNRPLRIPCSLQPAGPVCPPLDPSSR